jgi:hypothetical protein
MKRCYLPIVVFALVIFSICIAGAEEFHVLDKGGVRVLFNANLMQAAEEVLEIFPEISSDIETTFGWDLGFRPTVLLIRDRRPFGNMANPLIVAFAEPRKDLIVIDYTKMTNHPFNIRSTLKHELCHLLLHHHIASAFLPRWLDEGVCQWASDWIGNIMIDQQQSYLNRSAIRGTFLSLRSLKDGFPSEKEDMILAYEESKSFVSYIIGRFGKEGILSVLDRMKKGEDVKKAFSNALSMPLRDLEIEWQDSVRNRITWFTQLSYNLYEILFALMAIVCMYGFIRMIIKKRSMADEDEDDGLL